MENYQLYRTNVLLGGQLKWDLLLNSFEGELLISDFHLSPISKSVPYNKYSKENLLNYTHQENVRNFYKKTSGSFYNEFVEPKLNGAWPIICKEGETLDTHENTYEMGCRRAQYGVYKRQFEFFCPLWLEKLDENDVLKFEIGVLSYDADDDTNRRLITKKALKIKNLKKNHDLHNKFVKYFQDYCKFIHLDKGNDDILAVHLNKGISQISGLDVTNGNFVIKDLPDLVRNLLSRERPLIEFDSMLINEFKRNHLIPSQLFNLNLCLNVDDLIPKSIDITGQQFTITVDVFINDKQLKSVDFYSNYEYIRKIKCGPKLDDTRWDWKFRSHMFNPEEILNSDLIYSPNIISEPVSLNVLNYLNDHKCLELINKNKIVQNIIHWSLYDNNDYILNAYEGFSGYSQIDWYDYDQKTVHPHLYDNTPNIQQRKYSGTSNNVGWCNYVVISKSEDPSAKNENYKEFPRNKAKWLQFASDFSKPWVNNIKYYDNSFTMNDERDLKVLLVKLTHVAEFDPKDEDQVLKTDDIDPPVEWFEGEGFEGEEYKINDHLWYTYLYAAGNSTKAICLISNKMDCLTFANMLDELKEYEKKCKSNFIHAEPKLISLLHKMQSADSSNNPPIISLKNSLITTKAKGPSLLTNELEYYKLDNSSNYVMRYSGKIKPTFIDPFEIINNPLESSTDSISNRSYQIFNYLYCKDYLSDNRKPNRLSKYQKSLYSMYSNSGLQPLYPSIGYYSNIKVPMLERHKRSEDFIDHYSIVPDIKVSEHEKNSIRLINKFEYPWFNNGVNLFLIPEPDQFTLNTKEIGNLKNGLELWFCTKYSINRDEERDLLDYIYNLYKIDCSLEYAKPESEDITNYIYKIKLKLK